MEIEGRSRSRDKGFGEEIPKTKRLFIGGINGSITKEVIEDNFGGYGNIIDLFVKVRPDNSAFGIIQYATQQQADAAINGFVKFSLWFASLASQFLESQIQYSLNRTTIGECRVFVNYSKPRNNNGGGRSRDPSSSMEKESFGGRGKFEPNNDFNRNVRPQGGGRGGGDRPRGCFNCSSPSHFSRECPKGTFCLFTQPRIMTGLEVTGREDVLTVQAHHTFQGSALKVNHQTEIGRNNDREGGVRQQPRGGFKREERKELPKRENPGSRKEVKPLDKGADQDQY